MHVGAEYAIAGRRRKATLTRIGTGGRDYPRTATCGPIRSFPDGNRKAKSRVRLPSMATVQTAVMRLAKAQEGRRMSTNNNQPSLLVSLPEACRLLGGHPGEDGRYVSPCERT